MPTPAELTMHFWSLAAFPPPSVSVVSGCRSTSGERNLVVFHSEGCEDVMAEVDPTTVTTHVRAYWAKKKKVLDEIVLKDTLGAPGCRPLCVRSALHQRSEAHPNPNPPNRYRHLRTRAPL